jgi:NADH:ubiquinone oxidoreductase subunit E
VGETSADAKFTLVELECLGSCGTAPAALVNDVLYENLTPEALEKVLDELPDDPQAFKDPSIDWQEEDAHH